MNLRESELEDIIFNALKTQEGVDELYERGFEEIEMKPFLEDDTECNITLSFYEYKFSLDGLYFERIDLSGCRISNPNF